MIFRGINSSPWSRAAYLLVVLCFVAVPLHIFAQNLAKALVYFSGGVFLFSLLVAILHNPRDIRLGVFGFLAWLVHFCL